MDPHHHSISVGLYVRSESGGAPVATIHSYSRIEGTPARLGQIADAMCAMAGMQHADAAATVSFPCGTWHEAAARRLFLEACKHDPSAPHEHGPLEVPDTRTDQTIRVVGLGNGVYRVEAVNVAEGEASRAPAIARAIAKLAELELQDDDVTVTFACDQPHDDLVAMLLTRAQNLRAILREEELQANRGVLAAPSGQE